MHEFAKVTINDLEELAGLLGPREVTFHSQDHKAKVPIEITAESKHGFLTNVDEVKEHLARPQLCSGIAAQLNSISNWGYASKRKRLL